MCTGYKRDVIYTNNGVQQMYPSPAPNSQIWHIARANSESRFYQRLQHGSTFSYDSLTRKTQRLYDTLIVQHAKIAWTFALGGCVNVARWNVL